MIVRTQSAGAHAGTLESREGVPSFEHAAGIVAAVGVSRGGFLQGLQARPELSLAQIFTAAQRFVAAGAGVAALANEAS